MIPSTDEQYASLIRTVMERGKPITTRNSRVLRVVNYPITFDRFPLVSVRKTAWKNCIREWEFFMSGSDRLDDLHESVRPWWEPFTKKQRHKGEIIKYLPYNYSSQFRNYQGTVTSSHGCEQNSVDQIDYLVNGLREHPYSRRHTITTWNTADMVVGGCNPSNCHGTVIQCFVDEENNLDLVMYQRSVDVICGMPHNICQYWSFLLWLAHETGRKVGKFHWIGGDVHVYEKHFDLANKILLNVEKCTSEPDLIYDAELAFMNDKVGVFKADHFKLKGEYNPVLLDKAEMIV